MKIINPSINEAIRELPLASEKDIDAALEEARRESDQGEWPRLPPNRRKEVLLKISQGITDKAGELAALESQNTGKPLKETTFMDVPAAAETFRYFAENLEDFLACEEREISTQIAKAQARLIREALGVAVLIVPWNYPLLIASWKTAQALAAGNTVILKPSSLTPLTAIELEKIIRSCGIGKSVFRVINAPGEQAGRALCSDKRVDMVSFTGSNEVGRKILNYISENVKKAIMELGGKSAAIIFQDADFEACVNGTLCSAFLNQGQMCTQMSRIFIEDALYDKFRAEFVSRASKIKLGAAGDFEAQMGPLISETQRKKAVDYVEKAKKQGAKLLCGGKIPDSAELKKGFFFSPAVLEGVTPEMSVFKKEVFAPVVFLSRFSSQEDAVNSANASDFALACCIWTKDENKAMDTAKKINCGTAWVNTYGMFFNQLPYGGFKQSGFGKELGKEGFLEYTRLKNIVVDKAKDTKPIVNYWYGF